MLDWAEKRQWTQGRYIVTESDGVNLCIKLVRVGSESDLAKWSEMQIGLTT
jgi:hypothetical protein